MTDPSRAPFVATATLAFLIAPLAAQVGEPVALTPQMVIDRPGLLRPSLPRVRWVPGTDTLWMARAEGEGDAQRESLLLARPGGGGWREVCTARDLAGALRRAGVEGVDKPGAVSLAGSEMVGERTVRVERPDGVFHWRIGAQQARRVLALPPGDGAVAFARRDARAAVIRDHDLHVVRGGDAPVRVTEDGSEDIVYGGAAHRAEFGIHDGLWWGPQGRRLAFYREDMRPIAPYPYADYDVHPPAPVHGRYPMAGLPHSKVTVGVYDTADGSLRYLEHDPEADLYWTNVTFSPDGSALYVALVDRSQDRMELVRFDAATGKRQRSVLVERDSEWIEPEHGPIFVPDGTGDFLWFSPRDGFRHLYRYDEDGELVGRVTRGAFDVREHLGFTDDGASLVMASGENPLEMHLWSVPAQGPARRLTGQRGWHHCSLDSDGRWALSSHSSLDDPGAIDVVSTAGGDSERLARAADPLAGFVTGVRQFFEVEAADGTTLHGLVLLPPGVSPAGASERRYPVLQYVYGGPHSQLVRDTWLGGANPWLHAMAANGFVVFVVDNRGTDNRGIEFAQAVFRRLGTLEVEDQVRALDHVCSLPCADRTRVGVHGWSYGGFMTLSLMTRAAERYAAGVAGAPVTEWESYETGYTERYMDTPKQNPDGYRAASVVRRVGGLKGRLLLVHGTDDKTVMWSHSMRFLQGVIRAGRLVDFMAYPMQLHGLRGAHRKHFYRLMTRHFVEHLRP